MSTFTRPDGSTYELDHNEAVYVNGVDAAGLWLGHVPKAEAFAAVYPPPADGTYTWDFQAARWTRVYQLEELKAQKWEDIKAIRDGIEFSTFTWDGSVFDCDSTSTSRIMGAFSLALVAVQNSQDFQMPWTLHDNTVRVLSGADMIAVGVALGSYVAQAHATASTIRSAIEAATDATQLSTISWPS